MRLVARRSLALAAALLLVQPTGAVLAQDWPSKPIRFIVPHPPGGGTDIVARALARMLQDDLAQPVVVENRPGGNEIVGTQAIARANPDGYTIGLVTNTFAINPTLYGGNLPYDSAKDFAPVTKLVNMPFVLLTAPALPVGSVAELVQLAKSKPGQINYAHLGSGSPHFLAGEWFKRVAGVDVVGVAYKGAAEAMTGVSGGEVQFVFTGVGAGMAQVRAGRLKALAVTPAQRLAALPELATVSESGYPDYDINTWHGTLLPAGTPKEILNRLNGGIVKALGSAELRERLTAMGAEPTPMSPTQFASFLHADTEMWAKIVTATGAKP